MRFHLSIAICVMLMAKMAIAAITPFEESFDGNGPYASASGNVAGLDLPGWRIGTGQGGDVGTLDGSGYVFYAKATDPFQGGDQDLLFRDLEGIGSFRQSVIFSQIDMGNLSNGPDSVRTQILLRHFFLDSQNKLAGSINISLRGICISDWPAERVGRPIWFLGKAGTDVSVPRSTRIELARKFHPPMDHFEVASEPCVL